MLYIIHFKEQPSDCSGMVHFSSNIHPADIKELDIPCIICGCFFPAPDHPVSKIFFEDLLLGLIAAIPFFVFLIVNAVIIIIIVCAVKKKRRTKAAKALAEKEAAEKKTSEEAKDSEDKE